VLVTGSGHLWWSRVIPIQIEEIEAMAAHPSTLETFSRKSPLDGLLRR